MKFLFQVAEVIELSGRGCFILSDIHRGDDEDWLIKVGDQILVRKADGSEICTKIRALEFADRLPQKKSWLAIGVEQDVHRSDIEVGSQVWLIESTQEQPGRVG